jgi:hypothetical protein
MESLKLSDQRKIAELARDLHDGCFDRRAGKQPISSYVDLRIAF